jgi:hypothetical protein
MRLAPGEKPASAAIGAVSCGTNAIQSSVSSGKSGGGDHAMDVRCALASAKIRLISSVLIAALAC